MIPVTRKEQYLNRLAGEEQSIPDEPVTRTEQYLARLCGMETEIPSSPLTREEAYLAYLNGEDVTLPEPITRLEQFMAFAAGESETKPTPLTREEFYWDKYQGGQVPEEKTIDFASIITVTDALAKPLKACTVKINPVQSGSGDPSPDNIRPISGWTGANVVVSPTTDAEDGQTYTITFPSEAGTVYGGTLDVVNGVLTVDKFKKIISSSDVLVGGANYARCIVSRQYEGFFKNEKIISNVLNPWVGSASSVPEGCAEAINSSAYGAAHIVFCFDGCRGTNPNSTRNLNTEKIRELEDDGKTVEIVYEVSNPITYQLTPTEVQMLIGTNNIWADTGDISITYLAKGGNAQESNRSMALNLQKLSAPITEDVNEEDVETEEEEPEENADER